MSAPFIAGLTAALFVSFARYIQQGFEPSFHVAALVAVIAVLAAFAQYLPMQRQYGSKYYAGLPDLLIHIHDPSRPDSSLRWVIRALISALLFIFGGMVGVEGAAIELVHSILIQTRARSAQWFEQRRRTDAGIALTSGVAAAFGVPKIGEVGNSACLSHCGFF